MKQHRLPSRLGRGQGGYVGVMTREAFEAYVSKVKSADCFHDDHEACSGSFDLGDEVVGSCNCRCHFSVALATLEPGR